MTKDAHTCFIQQVFGQFSIMTSSFQSWVCGAVMQARLKDERRQTSFIEFLNGKRDLGVRQWSHLIVTSLAQLFPQHPVGRYVGCICVCTRLNTPVCVNEWTLWMKTLLPELQTGGEIILLKWRIPHPPTPFTRPPILVGANLNESHQWTKRKVEATWLMTTPSNISFPRFTERDHSIVYIHTDTTDFLWYSAVVFQSIGCWSRVLIIFASFVHVLFRNRVEWIWWLATYWAVCESKWQWVT